MTNITTTSHSVDDSPVVSSAEIIPFPQRMRNELTSSFIAKNLEFVQNYEQCGDVDTDVSFPAIKDMMKRQKEPGYDTLRDGTLYGKILDAVHQVNFADRSDALIGRVTYKTHSYVWKILFLNENEIEVSPEVAMESTNITRRLAILLPKRSFE